MTQGVQPLARGDLGTFYGVVTMIYTLDKLISRRNSLYYLEKVLDTSISIGSYRLMPVHK